MKTKQLQIIFSGFLAAGLFLASCKKDAQAPEGTKTGGDLKTPEKTVEIQNSQSHLENDPDAIPIKDRRRTTAYFRKVLNDQGIQDEKVINAYLDEQERQMRELESINAFKKYKELKQQQLQNGEAMHGACVVANAGATGGFQYEPIVTPGWTSGYGPATVTRPNCSYAIADYLFHDHVAPISRFLHQSRVSASKINQNEMVVYIYPDANPNTYRQAYGVVQIYQLGADNQWYLISNEQGAVGSNPGLLPNLRRNVIHVTTDNWRCYAVNISSLGQIGWLGGTGDNIWKGTGTGFYIEDDDIYYNPPCWITNTCPDPDPCPTCGDGEPFWKK